MSKMLSILISLLLLPFSLFAANQAPQDLQVLLNSFQTLSADFSQTITASNHKQLQQSKGTLLIHRPGQLRWHTIEPNSQLIIANQDKLWIYDEDLEQVTVQTLQQITGNSPQLLLSGNIKLISQDFTILSKYKTSDLQSYQLVPKQKDSYFKWIEIYFKKENQDDWILSTMRMKDSIDQVTQIEFFHVLINPTIKAALFNFVPPQGVDVIEMKN